MRTQNYTALEGQTFMFPLCVFANVPAINLQAVINWGDGSKETISNLLPGINTNHFYKLVEKKYTFPGTYNISIQAKRIPSDPFTDGLKTVAQHNMTVLPSTLTFAPSADLIVSQLTEQNRNFDLYLYDGASPHSFTGKRLRSNIYNSSGTTPIASFVLTVDLNIPGKVNVALDATGLAAIPLTVQHPYIITEEPNPPTTNPPLSSIILQGRVRKTSITANGIQPS